MQLKSVFYTRAISCRRAGKPLQAASAVLMLLLSAALLLASCANAVNSRGGPIDAGGGCSGSSGTSSGNTTINSSRGGGTVNSAGNGISNGGSAPDIVIGANAASYEVDRSRSVDFSGQTGTSADASSGLGYVTVTPLPAGTLFTETQSGLAVTWTTYSVTVTINGTDFPVTFSGGDTQAVVIEKVPVGATLSASATIGVPENLGYPGNAFSAATASPVAIQSGSNTITMWAQYPLVCQISSDAAGLGAAITGTAPSYYTNAGPTLLPAVSPSCTDTSTTPAATMRFTGWSLTDGGAPGIAGTGIPAGQYKGKLTLYASYLGIPALKITLTPPSGFPSKTVGTDTVYLVTDDSLTDTGKKFRLTVEPVNSTDAIPAGTKFSWKFGTAAYTTASAADNPRDVTAGTMGNIGTAPAAQTSYTVSCTASLTGADDVSVNTTVILAPATVTMKTGSQIRTILTSSLSAGSSGAARSFAASASAPAAGTATYKLSTDDSNVDCLAWLDGTAIKYYAEGYTDASPAKKIPLNANSSQMFYNCQVLTSIDVSGFDTSKVTNMGSMFYECRALTSLDVSGFDTANVTNMYGMFRFCYALTSITGLNSFDTSKVTNMESMFQDCQVLTSLNVSSFDTSKVTTMEKMFSACNHLTSLDVSGFDTSNVTNMEEMFDACYGLTSLDVSSIDTSKVTNMKNMFRYCSGLTSLDVSSFDTSKVTNMEYMFCGCSGLISLDISNFDTGDVTTMEGMFKNCSDLVTIYASAPNISAPAGSRGFVPDALNGTYMFYNCTSLKGGGTPQTAYDSSHTDKEYARIDGGSTSATPGYVTAAP